jgi:hypothetical protein
VVEPETGQTAEHLTARDSLTDGLVKPAVSAMEQSIREQQTVWGLGPDGAGESTSQLSDSAAVHLKHAKTARVLTLTNEIH